MISKEKLESILEKYSFYAPKECINDILAALKEEQPVASTGEALAEPVLWQNMTAIKRHGEIVFEIHPGDEAICLKN